MMNNSSNHMASNGKISQRYLSDVVNAQDKSTLSFLLGNLRQTINPFYHEDKMNLGEYVKNILGIVIVPIKLLLILPLLFVMALCVYIGTSTFMGLRPFDQTKPLSPFRKFCLLPVPYLLRAGVFIVGVHRIRIVGANRRVDKKIAPVVIVCPHSSIIDSVVVGAVIGVFSGFAKKEVESIPLFGRLGQLLQTVWVERGSHSKRKTALETYTSRVKELHEDGQEWLQFLSFPEGTCTNRKALITFQKGAFVPGAPCQLLMINYPGKFNTTWTSSGPNRFYMIYRLFVQWDIPVEIEFSEVIYPNELMKQNGELYAFHVRDIAAKKVGIPTSNHSYSDTFLSKEARDRKVRPDMYCDFAMDDLKDLMTKAGFEGDVSDVGLDEGKRAMKKFISVLPKNKLSPRRKNGLMNFGEFFIALDCPENSRTMAAELFSLVDANKDGLISFREFFILSTFMSAIAVKKLKESEAGAIDKIISQIGGTTSAIALRSAKVNPGNVVEGNLKRYFSENKETLFFYL